MAGAHDVDYALLVEVGVALVEEHQRRVVAFLQSLGVAVVVHRDRLDAVTQVVFQLHLGPLACLVAGLQGLDELVGGIGQDVAYVVLVLQDERGGAYLSI